jgi:hypothetical protein
MNEWHELFDRARSAFVQQRTFERARLLGASGLACLGRHTLSGLLCAAGQQFTDWSSSYRLFEHERLDLNQLWQVPLQSVLESLSPQAPVVALIDDTLVRKRGRRIGGTSWRRDPLGPHFTHNFIWASRFLQLSLALPDIAGVETCAARAIPVDLVHAPSPRKPSRRASAEQWASWREASAASAISALGARRMQSLRESLDQLADGKQRRLWMCADATFTNRTVLQQLPPRTTLIGRIRKDARLYALPAPDDRQHRRGRGRYYGQLLPTPEQYRQDDTIPWQSVSAFAAGHLYSFEIKHIAPLRWKNGSGNRNLSLLIVRPVAYRLRQNHRLNYRNPAYLICTDLSLTPQQILQSYIWRWEIEVNFRDQKTLLGFGQPQVRTEAAVRTTSAFYVFTYALLLLALHRCRLAHQPLPAPRWQRYADPRRRHRITTPQALSLFRSQLWAAALGFPNKNGFAASTHSATKPFLFLNSLQSAVLYATG